jgi:hypothetical protein
LATWLRAWIPRGEGEIVISLRTAAALLLVSAAAFGQTTGAATARSSGQKHQSLAPGRLRGLC